VQSQYTGYVQAQKRQVKKASKSSEKNTQGSQIKNSKIFEIICQLHTSSIV